MSIKKRDQKAFDRKRRATSSEFLPVDGQISDAAGLHKAIPDLEEDNTPGNILKADSDSSLDIWSTDESNDEDEVAIDINSSLNINKSQDKPQYLQQGDIEKQSPTRSSYGQWNEGPAARNGSFSEGEDSEDNADYETVTDANGRVRYIYNNIDPIYDSDDSDALEQLNTAGNIDASLYDSFPHIGYDVEGRKIMRPAQGEALDALLESIDIPAGWTGLTDPATGKPLELDEEELTMLKKVIGNEVPLEGYDAYPDMVEYFSGVPELMPLSAAPEPKRRFVPSKQEAKRVMKIVRAIKEGRIQPYKRPNDAELLQQAEEETRYDLWANEDPQTDNRQYLPAPKLPPPGHDTSYHPPPEYLPDDQERADWEGKDPEERGKDFLSRDHDALRKVPGHDGLTRETFERCLDLYLAPRVRHSKLDIDPDSLLPKLPQPEELRPFPTACATVYRGHEGRVRAVSVDPSGLFMASGGDDGTLRIWELLTGRQLAFAKLSEDESVNAVRWRPGIDLMILAVAVGNDLLFVVPAGLADAAKEKASTAFLDAGFDKKTDEEEVTARSIGKKPEQSTWSRPKRKSAIAAGVVVKLQLRAPARTLAWHRRGGHVCTVSHGGQASAVAVHSLERHRTQYPFRRLPGAPQAAVFHPSRPILFIATQQAIRGYDLSQSQQQQNQQDDDSGQHTKLLKPGARWLSSLDVHPGGDNIVAGAYDRRLIWHDLELSAAPYKTLRYHPRAVRAVRFHHGGYPLLVDASDDGTLQVFHARAASIGESETGTDNATIVPVKVLRGHNVTAGLGVLDVEWHPRQAWCVSAGADGTCRLWL